MFEVHHTPPGYEYLIGQVVPLRWSTAPGVQGFVRSVRKNVHFSAEAIYSQQQGYVHPFRLNHWQQVGPLESLAGAHPVDDVIVMLSEPVEMTEGEVGSRESGIGSQEPGVGSRVVETQNSTHPSIHPITPSLHHSITLHIRSEPVQITGRYYALVKILGPAKATTSEVGNQITSCSDRFRVVHFNPISRQFDGVEEVVRIPQVVADMNGIFPSSNRDIDKSPPNEWGWYIYGAKNGAGVFVVQAIAPRALLRLQPDEFIVGRSAT
ncbi:hypothetical protein [Leptothermofonsia sp. ETS-13]|uniref:hypothetical protein n=1 Tax=Leptothermofonsia sp. ETS-13 TaxID=3035696 RepID=UPI003BA2307F